MLKVLTFTTLYPNSAQPSHGIFVENRLRHVWATGEVDGRVVAPVPFFPFESDAFGRYGVYARIPESEIRLGTRIAHPRYLAIPKVGMSLAPRLLYLGARRAAQDMAAALGRIDLVDAHYLYPDGVAAARIARDLGVPFVLTARGTDVNLIPEFASPRRQLLDAVAAAAHVITVCAALKEALVELGVPDEQITVLRNGVDLEMFNLGDRNESRAALSLRGFTLLSVGHLVERKGHHLVIDALADLPGMDLLIVGDGPDREVLERRAESSGVAGRVRFLGSVPHESLSRVYEAADALVLASSREGWPNVLLEAMACGTPVVATDVWGSGEVVQSPVAGLLVRDRTAPAIAEAINCLVRDMPDREATRRYAELFSWDDTTKGQLRIFRNAVAATGKAPLFAA